MTMTDQERNDLVQGVMAWAVKCFQKFAPGMFKHLGIDEVNQECFLHLMTHAHKYDPKKGKPTTWTYFRIRQLTSHLSRKQRSNPLRKTPVTIYQSELIGVSDGFFEDAVADDLVASEPPEFGFDEMGELRDALATLNQRYRDVLLLSFLGWKLSEIGDKFGVSRERIRQIRDKAVVSVAARLGVKLDWTLNNRSRFCGKRLKASA